jgi:hypothetical protein
MILLYLNLYILEALVLSIVGAPWNMLHNIYCVPMALSFLVLIPSRILLFLRNSNGKNMEHTNQDPSCEM